MKQPLSPRDHALLALLFGALIAYLAYGAFVGYQFIPRPRSQAGGLYLSGLAAWIVAFAPALIYLGILVRHGLFGLVGPRVRLAIEFGLLLSGLAAFIGGVRWGILQCNC